MAPSRVIILGVAAVAAAGAGYIAKNMTGRSAEPIIVEAPNEPAVRLAEVLVLEADVPMGGSLDGKIGWQSWPQGGINENFITRERDPEARNQLQASIARVAMYRGEPLRRSKLIGEGQSFMSSILPSGKRAIATRVTADTSAGGFILPNDHVDVIMTRRAQDGGAADGYVTETILRNVRVLAIDQAIQEDEEGRRVRVGDTATLELTPQQAEIITVGQQMADRLTLALRAVSDTQEVVDQGADYLVSGSGRRGTVRMIKAGTVSEEGSRR